MVGLVLASLGLIQARREAIRADHEVDIARTQAARSKQVSQFMEDILSGASPWVALGQDTTLLREILDSTAERITRDLANQPEVQGELLNKIGLVYGMIGELSKAESAYREAIVVERKIPGNGDFDLATSLFGLAQVLEDENRPADSEAYYRESLETWRRIFGNEHLNEHLEAVGCLNNITGPLVAQGKLSEAEAFSREALAMKRKLLPSDHPQVAISLRDLGRVLQAEGKYAEAEKSLREGLAIFRQTLGDIHPDVAFTLNGLADVLSDEGKLTEAETADREALAIQTKLYDSKSYQLANTQNGLIAILQKEGKQAEVEKLRHEVTEPVGIAKPKPSTDPQPPKNQALNPKP